MPRRVAGSNPARGSNSKGPMSMIGRASSAKDSPGSDPSRIYSKYSEDRCGQIEAVTVHFTSGLKSTIIHG